MENIEDEIKKGKLVIKIQEIWSVANNIIGYSLIAAVIILGVITVLDVIIPLLLSPHMGYSNLQ